ncbi:MAG: hypothetical protein AAGB13_15440, partial [Cyanobacteria bacterium P01_F01_bin.33]
MAVIFGTRFNDNDSVNGSPLRFYRSLSGTADADVIYGWTGDDTIYGNAGNDFIYGDRSPLTLFPFVINPFSMPTISLKPSAAPLPPVFTLPSPFLINISPILLFPSNDRLFGGEGNDTLLG